jgi:hypothetical protein
MTPAQQAKEFAVANGFTIVSDDKRRYNVLFDGSLIANVGGYPAALNAMRKHLETSAHADVVSDDGALGVFADAIVGQKGMTGCAECTDEPECAWHQLCIRSAQYAKLTDPNGAIQRVKVAIGAELDAIGLEFKLEPRNPGETDATYRRHLMLGTRHPFAPLSDAAKMSECAMGAGVDEWAVPLSDAEVAEMVAPVFVPMPKHTLDPLFDGFNAESKKRIRVAAAKLCAKTGAQTARWAIFIGGKEWLRFGTRERCIKESRRLHNGNSKWACWGGVRTIRQLTVGE